MIMRMLGADTIALAMGPDRRGAWLDLDCSWLLAGPTDETVVEPPGMEADLAPPLRWAAE